MGEGGSVIWVLLDRRALLGYFFEGGDLLGAGSQARIQRVDQCPPMHSSFRRRAIGGQRRVAPPAIPGGGQPCGLRAARLLLLLVPRELLLQHLQQGDKAAASEKEGLIDP